MRNEMIADDKSFHLVTQITDMGEFLLYFCTYQSLGFERNLMLLKNYHCIFIILSLSLYLDQNKF